MALCRVTGTLYVPSGEPAASHVLYLTRLNKSVVADYNGSVVPEVVRVPVGRDGSVDFDILTGTYVGYARPNNLTSAAHGYEFSFTVQDSETARFEDCIGAASVPPAPPVWYTQALAARDEAVDARDAAEASAETVAGMQDDIDQAVLDSGIALSAAVAADSKAVAAQAVIDSQVTPAQLRKNTLDATRAPLPTDDASQGYEPGSRWLWQEQEWLLTETGWVPAPIAPYSSRAAAEAANVPSLLDRIGVFVPNGGTLWYKRDTAGTALTTGDGAKWSPDGDVTPQHFGAVGDGVADDTAAVQAAVDYVASTGGGIVNLGPFHYGIGATIEVQNSSVKLCGSGKDIQHLSGGTGDGPATKFTWSSASALPMFSFFSPQGSGNHKRNGQELSGCFLDGAGTASKGVNIMSVNELTLSDIHIENVTEDAVFARCYNSGDLADATDNQRLFFFRVTFSLRFGVNSTSANGINLGGSPIVPGGNTSLNVFEMVQGETNQGIGLLIDNADNSNFFRCGFTCANAGTFAVEIRGNGASGTNHFYNLTATRIGAGAVSAIKLAGIASGFPNNTLGNSFWMSDNSNGTQPPNADAGCTYTVVQDNGFSRFEGFSSSVFGQDRAGALSARAALGSGTAVLHNKSNDHFKLIGDTAGAYGINIAPGTDNLRISRSGGSGYVEIVNTGLIATMLVPVDLRTVGGGVGGFEVVLVDVTSASRTISLPLASTYPTGKTPRLQVVRVDASANTLTVRRQASDTLNGGASETLAAGQGKTYVCNPGTGAWYSF